MATPASRNYQREGTLTCVQLVNLPALGAEGPGLRDHLLLTKHLRE